MNENYWDEYIRYYVDDEIRRKMIKQHLSADTSLFRESCHMPDNLLDMWKRQQQTVNYPNTVISTTDFNALTKELQNILKVLYNLTCAYNIISFLPILSQRGDNLVINNYGIDFEHSKLVLYNHYASDFMERNSLTYVISFFQNLDESILLYNSEAYIQTILQIGFIQKSLENFFNGRFLIKEVMEPKQKWTFGLGINPYRELLITTTCIGELDSDFFG